MSSDKMASANGKCHVMLHNIMVVTIIDTNISLPHYQFSSKTSFKIVPFLFILSFYHSKLIKKTTNPHKLDLNKESSIFYFFLYVNYSIYIYLLQVELLPP